jgi:hypothetical protein
MPPSTFARCRPEFWAEHPAYAADICTLHGGGSMGGEPDLPPDNVRSDNNQYFKVEKTGGAGEDGRGRQRHSA